MTFPMLRAFQAGGPIEFVGATQKTFTRDIWQTLTLPSGVVAGDLLIMVVMYRRDNEFGLRDYPVGYTERHSAKEVRGERYFVWIGTKTAGASETGPEFRAWSEGAAGMLVYRNAKHNIPVKGDRTLTEEGFTITALSTTSVDECAVAALYFIGNVISVVTPPSGMEPRINITEDDAIQLIVYDEVPFPAGTVTGDRLLEIDNDPRFGAFQMLFW